MKVEDFNIKKEETIFKGISFFVFYYFKKERAKKGCISLL